VRQDGPQRPTRSPRRGLAIALAIAVHAAFIGVLVFSLRWQNRPPEPVTAELYAPPTKAPPSETPLPPPAPEPAPPVPVPVPAPAPAPEPKVAPPPKPEPKVERPDPHAAEIALKQKQEEERQRREREQKDAADKRERDRKEAEKRDVERKKQDEQKKLAEARDRQTKEADALRAQAEREKAARDAQQRAVDAETAARSRAEADYIRRIQSKVKGNVTLPPDLSGNPEAIFDVLQLPTGEIIDAVLRKSSGVRAYDEAVQRAIVKSSPLPRPDRAELFQRTLTLKFRPQD
jgi:colicin import membrane protein